MSDIADANPDVSRALVPTAQNDTAVVESAPRDDVVVADHSGVSTDRPVGPETIAAPSAPVSMALPDAIACVLGSDPALIVSGAASIKHFAMNDVGEHQCVEAGACVDRKSVV